MSDDQLIGGATVRILQAHELRALIASLCDIVDKTANVAVASYRREVDPQRVVGIRSHVRHAAKLSRAILLIDDELRGYEMVPLVRMLQECAVTAAWLLITPGSGHTLLRHGAGEWKRALENLQELGQETQPGYDQAVGAIANLEEAEGPRSFMFKKRCHALRQGKHLYALYQVLSAQAHAGMGVADMYLVDDERSPIGLSFVPDPVNDTRTPTLGIAASMLLLAVNADELAGAKPKHTTQIARAAKRLGVGTRILGANGEELPPRN